MHVLGLPKVALEDVISAKKIALRTKRLFIYFEA
jgi:hypothetical protein